MGSQRVNIDGTAYAKVMSRLWNNAAAYVDNEFTVATLAEQVQLSPGTVGSIVYVMHKMKLLEINRRVGPTAHYHVAKKLRERGLDVNLANFQQARRDEHKLYLDRLEQEAGPEATARVPQVRGPRKSRVPSMDGVLITMAYGENETLTISYNDASRLHEQLATLLNK